MPNQLKYNRILDALQELLKNQKMQTISVSDIAQTAGIGKGSIYYYFPSKDAILDALVERNYEKPLRTAKDLADQTEISPFTRMAMIFQACRSSSSEFLKSEERAGSDTQEKVFLRQKYVNHIITELKPVLAEIIRQGVETGDRADRPGSQVRQLPCPLLKGGHRADHQRTHPAAGEGDGKSGGLVELFEEPSVMKVSPV